ncbi:MAG: [FeFe] hydrogenase H-cluster radical SAM maturase HydE [Spirochaetales bacterium]|nr:[FeFe] hydrogenase H-cluster radical SAM maturase HydE [Spirochaetales bacterium]
MSDGNLFPTPEHAVALYREDTQELYRQADRVRRRVFGDRVFVRGLLEFTNVCAANCHYCGIRRDNTAVHRYRMDEEGILDVIGRGIERGMKTFVLQGGEDPEWTTARLCRFLERVRLRFGNETAITLSCGLKSPADYRDLKHSGADRYLMRFETGDPVLHQRLRNGISLKRRLKGLHDLKDAGFEVGSGYMTGLPGETEDIRIRNALLCRELELDMVGIGPFIPHPQTPLGGSPQESLSHAVRAVALVRLLLPEANIPATTAAGSLQPDGREQMLKAGANVLMPNITPVDHKKDYLLYPGKICLDESGFECVGCLSLRVKTVDQALCFDRGDSPAFAGRTG